MDNDLKALQKEIRKQKARGRIKDSLFTIAIALLAGLFLINGKSGTDDVIRVKGIIVEDNEGRERILIGSPIPYAVNRARTDTVKISETWGKRFGEKYMEWYKGYNHQANGIVLLDENGWDKVIIGDPTPDPIIGKRIGNSTGIIINDSSGLERTGYGILDVQGEDRVVLGLDKNNGTEGLTLSVMPDGTTGLNINADGQSIFLGKAAVGNWNAPENQDFHGMIIRDNQKQDKIITNDR